MLNRYRATTTGASTTVGSLKMQFHAFQAGISPVRLADPRMRRRAVHSREKDTAKIRSGRVLLRSPTSASRAWVCNCVLRVVTRGADATSASVPISFVVRPETRCRTRCALCRRSYRASRHEPELTRTALANEICIVCKAPMFVCVRNRDAYPRGLIIEQCINPVRVRRAHTFEQHRVCTHETPRALTRDARFPRCYVFS